MSCNNFSRFLLLFTLLISNPLLAYEVYEAAQSGNAADVKQLLEKGHDANDTSDYGKTALYIAAARDLETAKVLIKYGANVNKEDYRGITPIMMAAEKGYSDIVELLVASDANINAKSKKGSTALSTAAANNHIDAVKVLLSAGANVNSKNSVGATPLMQTAYQGYFEVVKLLVEHGADVKIETSDGGSALGAAKAGGNKEVIKYLKKAMRN